MLSLFFTPFSKPLFSQKTSLFAYIFVKLRSKHLLINQSIASDRHRSNRLLPAKQLPAKILGLQVQLLIIAQRPLIRFLYIWDSLISFSSDLRGCEAYIIHTYIIYTHIYIYIISFIYIYTNYTISLSLSLSLSLSILLKKEQKKEQKRKGKEEEKKKNKLELSLGYISLSLRI